MPWIIDDPTPRAVEHFKDSGKVEMAVRHLNKRFAPYENLAVKWVDDTKDKAIDEKVVRNLMRNVKQNNKKINELLPKLDQIFQPLQNLQILSILNTALSAANLVATVAGMIIICDKLNGIERKLDRIQKEIADLKEIDFELQIYKPCRKLVDDYKMLTPDLTKGKFIPEEKLITLIRECKDYIISIYNLQARKILPMDVALNLIFDLLPIFANCLMVYYQRFYDPSQEKHPLHDSCMHVFDLLSASDFIDQVQDYMFVDKHQSNRQVNEYLDCQRMIVYSYRTQIDQLLEDLKTCGSKEGYEDVMQWSRQFAMQQAKVVEDQLTEKYGATKAQEIMAEAGLA